MLWCIVGVKLEVWSNQAVFWRRYLVARAGKAILLRLSAMLCSACNKKELLCNMHGVE